MTSKRPDRLTDEFVEGITEPGRYGDGRGAFGLSLLVKESSAEGVLRKYWSQRLRINGKETNRGLGSYPKVTLLEARRRALSNTRKLEMGEQAIPPTRSGDAARIGKLKLTDEFVKNVARPGRYGNGRGGKGLTLAVGVTKRGTVSKSWTQRLIINGKETNRGLGSYPVVTLEEARWRAQRNARAIDRGRGLPPKIGVAFRTAAERIIEQRQHERKYPRWAQIWRSSLERYTYPLIGDKLLEDITAKDVAGVVSAHWNRCPETMRRVKQRIGVVLDWAVREGHLPSNPARLVHTPSPDAVPPKVSSPYIFLEPTSGPGPRITPAIRK